jgi:diacylglycerol kinase (ATP)
MFESRETLVLWNPSAGSADPAGRLKSQLENAPNVRLLKTESRENCIERTQQACEDGFEVVIAGGGDGTVNAVVEGIMRSEEHPVMGILPLGTGNDFARSLGLKMNPAAALEQLNSAGIHPVDVMKYASSRKEGWYLNMLTGGNTGVYMDHMTEEIKRRWGPFSYMRGVIEVIQELVAFDVEVFLDDLPPRSYHTLNLFLANGRMSGGGMTVCPNASYDDGTIDVIVIREGLPGEIASLTTEYFLRDYLNHDLVEHLKAERVRIESDPPMPLTADGDRIGETPLLVEVLPGTLPMLVPANNSTRWFAGRTVL